MVNAEGQLIAAAVQQRDAADHFKESATQISNSAKDYTAMLAAFMTSGPVVVLALEKANAIADWRKLMGATNPATAEEGTIRKKHAESIERNAVHGSDAEDTARFELSFFFAGYELAK